MCVAVGTAVAVGGTGDGVYVGVPVGVHVGVAVTALLGVCVGVGGTGVAVGSDVAVGDTGVLVAGGSVPCMDARTSSGVRAVLNTITPSMAPA